MKISVGKKLKKLTEQKPTGYIVPPPSRGVETINSHFKFDFDSDNLFGFDSFISSSASHYGMAMAKRAKCFFVVFFPEPKYRNMTRIKKT